MPITLEAGQTTELSVTVIPVYVPPQTATLYGVVTDANTGVGVSGIEVSLDSLVRTTGADGRYEFADVEPGTYSLVFTDPQGVYETLEV